MTGYKMGFEFVLGAVLLMTIFSTCIANDTSSAISECSVMDNGARCDGNTDNSKAILSAWEQACKSTSPSTMVIPSGNYMLGPISFKGPCKAAVTVRVEGTLRAPLSLEAFKSQDGWITFEYIDQLTVLGGGKFDGQGKIAWVENNCARTGTCDMPANIRFTGITNGVVRDITSLDSKMFHINILNCNNLSLNNITIDSPATSPNTDGIHIGRSTTVNITGANIKTGDDCISIGDGSQHLNVENVTCGPGHGISIGSLGKYRGEQPVIGITVRNCTLANTMNGVRIKTWPSSYTGLATGLHFEDIIMDNVSNPILIDQDYCPSNLCKISVPSKIEIRDVLFKNIKGTSATQMAMQLMCSKGMPCEDVKLSDIYLKYMGKKGMGAISQCSNVKPTIMGNLSPSACLRS